MLWRNLYCRLKKRKLPLPAVPTNGQVVTLIDFFGGGAGGGGVGGMWVLPLNGTDLWFILGPL